MACWPGDNGTFVHFLLMLPIELGRTLEVAFFPKGIGSDVGVFLPQSGIAGKLVDELGPFPVPLRMPVTVQNLLSCDLTALHKNLVGGDRMEPVSGRERNPA